MIPVALSIWWANTRSWLRRHLLAEPTDAEGLTLRDRDDLAFFRALVLAKRAETARTARIIDGVEYRRTWAGLIRADKAVA